MQQRKQHVRLTSRRQKELKQQRSQRIEHLLLRGRPANGVKWIDEGGDGDDAANGEDDADANEVLRISVVSTSAMDKQAAATNNENLFGA